MNKLGILNGFNIYVKYNMNISVYEDKKWKTIRKFTEFYEAMQEKHEINDTSPIIETIENRHISAYKRLKGMSYNLKYDPYWKHYEKEYYTPVGMGIWKEMQRKDRDPAELDWLRNWMDEEDFGEFCPWVMINISPKWNKNGINWKKQSLFFQKIIANRYNKWERYVDKCEYVLEPGKTGEHLHVHILMRCKKGFNTKSFRTWISKGNLLQQFRTEFAKCKGFQGAVEATPAMQTKLCLNEEIRNDSLDYLEEGKKSEDHQNDFSYMPFLPLRVSL